METKELQELIEAVDKINEELEGQLGDKDGDMDPWIWTEIVHMSQNGTIVMILGETIWNSEWVEQREWRVPGIYNNKHYSEAHYEPIETHIRIKINELIGKLSRIKL